jgi:hypothetical protein
VKEIHGKFIFFLITVISASSERLWRAILFLISKDRQKKAINQEHSLKKGDALGSKNAHGDTVRHHHGRYYC